MQFSKARSRARLSFSRRAHPRGSVRRTGVGDAQTREGHHDMAFGVTTITERHPFGDAHAFMIARKPETSSTLRQGTRRESRRRRRNQNGGSNSQNRAGKSEFNMKRPPTEAASICAIRRFDLFQRPTVSQRLSRSSQAMPWLSQRRTAARSAARSESRVAQPKPLPPPACHANAKHLFQNVVSMWQGPCSRQARIALRTASSTVSDPELLPNQTLCPGSRPSASAPAAEASDTDAVIKAAAARASIVNLCLTIRFLYWPHRSA